MDQTFEKRKKVIYDFICDDFYVPMKIKEIAMVLQITKEQRKELQEVLDSLVEEGKISLSKRGKYSKGQTKRIMGTFQANIRGFGFVMVEGQEEDIFIPAENVNGAFQGDEVECIITGSPSGRRQEGKIVGIISHQVTKVVGLYEKSKSFGFVRPDNQRFLKDIYIPAGKELHAMTGHKVVVEPGTDILSIVKDFDIPTEFPEKVLNQAVRVGKEVSEVDMAGRMDLRDWQMVTIDGEDAKDLDDAVSVERDGENYVLGVHIADVTNYVQEKSALDREALERGTSVYLADRVIPMLPHILSNGVCSLNAGEERLALSCIMMISPKGEMISHEITESVICVDKRMSYNKVSAVLEQDEQALREYEGFVPMIWMMKELSELIRQKRGKRGAIDFDFPETKIVLDEDGKPIEVKPYDRNPATEIIEDFMLMANETVAEEFFWREIPFLYRTHEAPDEDRIRQLSAFVNSFGYHIHVGNEIRPKYTTENTGHFGLAAKYYTHFTSPIRRYPDLQIHRIIKENLRGRFDENRAEHYSELLQQVAAQCSERERRAEEAEREVVKLKKAEYMRDHIGEEFDGVISGVTKWGAYVELENTVEGLAHVADMWDDHYEFYEQSYELVGEHTGKTYKPGQKVRICVTDADKLQRTVNFRIL